jgi:hypothetical protein
MNTPLSKRIVVDDERDEFTFDGSRFGAEAFAGLLLQPTQPGRWFRVVEVRPGSAITIETKQEEAPE